MTTTFPCAYCGQQTALEDSTGRSWEWPGKGEVVACKRCAGYRADASAVAVYDGVTWEGVNYMVENVRSSKGKVRLELIGGWDDEDREPITITLDPTDVVELHTRAGW